MTQYYRVMNKSGGYTWMQTCATVVCNSKNADEQNIICVNYVISGKEYEHLIMDCCQLEETQQSVKREETGSGNDPENGSPDGDRGGAPPPTSQPPGRGARPAAAQPQPPPPGATGSGSGAGGGTSGSGGGDLEEEASGTEPHRVRHHPQHHLQVSLLIYN